MIKHARCRRISARRGVGTCLLIQPPVGQAQFSGYCPGFIKHDAVRLEQGINIAGSTARVIGQGHRGAAEYIDVGHHTALSQPVTESTKGILDALTIEEGRRFAHAASIS